MLRAKESSFNVLIQVVVIGQTFSSIMFKGTRKDLLLCLETFAPAAAGLYIYVKSS